MTEVTLPAGAALHAENPARTLEWCATVGVLVLFTGAVAGVVAAQSADATQADGGGGWVFRLLNLAAYAFTLFVTIRDRAFIPRAARRGALLNLLLGVAIASVLWSSAPGRTVGRVAELVVTTWFASYISRRYTLEEQLLLFADTLGVLLALSICAVALFPSATIMTGEFEGAWRGVFDHKNPLGRVALLGCLVFGLLTQVERQRIKGWVGAFVSLAVLVLSTSRSAMIELLVLIILLPLFQSLRRRGLLLGCYLGAAVAIPVVGGLWVYTHLDDVMALLGRNLTLSGRTSLWFAVSAFIAQRPFLGYGYNAFWQGMNGDSGYISLALRWEVPHAHNGLLELALDTGGVGVALFLGSAVVAIRDAVRTRRLERGAIAVWPLIGLTFTLITNLTETSLLRVNNTFWILYLVLALGARRTAGEGRDDG